MAYRISDYEIDALRGIPFEARALYHLLRNYMDYRTGRVLGKSWGGLGRDLAVDAHQGLSDTGTPSRSRVRRWAQWLVSKGLIAIHGDMEKRELAFSLLLADTDYSVSNKPDTNPTQTRQTKPDTNPSQPEALPDNGFGGLDGEIPEQTRQCRDSEKPTEYPVSDIRNYGSSERVSNTTRAGARGSLVPDDFAPDEHGVRLAQQHGLDLQVEAPKFVAYYQGLDIPTRSDNWQAKFRKWLLDAMQYRADSDRRAGRNGLAPAAQSAGDWLGSDGRFNAVAYINRNRQGRAL